MGGKSAHGNGGTGVFLELSAEDAVSPTRFPAECVLEPLFPGLSFQENQLPLQLVAIALGSFLLSIPSAQGGEPSWPFPCACPKELIGDVERNTPRSPKAKNRWGCTGATSLFSPSRCEGGENSQFDLNRASRVQWGESLSDRYPGSVPA